jgi:hypothetical protein
MPQSQEQPQTGQVLAPYAPNHASRRMEEMVAEQPEFFGVAPTDITRSTVESTLDPRRAPYIAYIVYPPNGRSTPNLTGTLLMGALG